MPSSDASFANFWRPVKLPNDSPVLTCCKNSIAAIFLLVLSWSINVLSSVARLFLALPASCAAGLALLVLLNPHGPH